MLTPCLLTLGDPEGLGPEIVCRLFAADPGVFPRPMVMIGPEQPLELHARRLGMKPFWTRLEPGSEPGPGQVGLLVPPGLEDYSPDPGKALAQGGRAAGLSLETACGLLSSGFSGAVVTCPLNKAMLQEAGFDFPGHTEFFAQRLGVGAEGVCMHLCGPRLRVSLATTHPPLALVPQLITREKILHCLDLTARLVRDLGVDQQPIAVCGLNPHAGESGKIGDEEIRIIGPAVEEARAMGLDVEGPLPGDTVFRLAADGRYSAVLAMYHDQGLAPLKLLHFHEAVNVTLGLPVVRTSVDHGTGYDLVGRDVADLSSLVQAMGLAERLEAARGR